jgi:hypothetical protein
MHIGVRPKELEMIEMTEKEFYEEAEHEFRLILHDLLADDAVEIVAAANSLFKYPER